MDINEIEMWKKFFGNQQCKNGAACRNIANGRYFLFKPNEVSC